MDTPVARPRWRFNSAFRLKPRLQVGLEYNPVVGEILPTANWVAQTESESKPMISFGTSSDRIGTPEGKHAYYVTLAKSLHGTGAAPYLSMSYSEFKRGFEFPFGVNFSLAPQWDVLPMNDGRHTHLLLTYKQENYNVTLMLGWLKRPGLSIGWAW